MEDVEKSTVAATSAATTATVTETGAADTAADSGESSSLKKTRNTGLRALKFWLMPFVFIASFGLSIPYGLYIKSLSLFAPIAFYILCGYAAAHGEKEWEAKPAEKKKGKSFHEHLVKRTALTFSVLMGILIILNIISYVAVGIPLNQVAAAVLTKRTMFDFLVLCKWPFSRIGETIWFLQALLYARIILWGMDRFKLMRYYKAVMVLTVMVMILFGELAAVIRFNFHGYFVIPGNGITRALPYMLIGRYIYEKKDKLAKIPSWVFGPLFLFGVFAALTEWEVLRRLGYLVYTGHLIGYGIMAFAACGFFLKKEKMKSNFAVVHGGSYARRMYAMSQPVGYLMLVIAAFIPPIYGVTNALKGLFAYLICLLIAFIVGQIKFNKPGTKSQKERFSLWLWIKHTFRHHKRKRNTKQKEWDRAHRGKFSLWRWLKHTFRRRSHKRSAEQKEWDRAHRGRFSLWLWLKHTFRHMSRRRRSRRNEWRVSRHRHHRHHHHHHHHHSHEHHSYDDSYEYESGSETETDSDPNE